MTRTRTYALIFLLFISLATLHAATHEEESLTIEALLADTLPHHDTRLSEAVVVGTGIKAPAQVALNAVSLDLRPLKGTTKSIADALTKAPGVKLREGGGVGSDLQLMIDGFGSKHVKIFVDGVPQEGVGSSFAIGNIPAGFAERIEVFRGVVPVGFGTDALGGVVNIVTSKRPRGWQLDASYSYGSFNTHRTHASFSHSLAGGFTYELTAYQNYSDNDYKVDVPVEDFETGRIDRTNLQRMKRFHDTYHNEAVTAKIGWVGRPWADRLMLGLSYAQEYKEIQTGVRQETVYGKKHRHGRSLMPSLQWRKRNLFVDNLDASFTLNYNKNARTNVDTAQVKYNWRGETHPLNSPGEQSLLHSRADNHNLNGTARVDYTFRRTHTFTLSHTLNAFERSNTSLLAKVEQQDAIKKRTAKHISGLSYVWTPSQKLTLSAFGKFYSVRVQGPVAVDVNATSFTKAERRHQHWGYGTAAAYNLPLKGLSVKASYEKALRLPTIEELFGDEDLEQGAIGIRPELSHNANLSFIYNVRQKHHDLYAELGFIVRDTRDYIQRNIVSLSGGKQAASYVNYGKVMTKGMNLSLRYQYADLFNVGGHFTQMDARDNMRTMMVTSAENLLYKDRMPNLPYQFADFDATVHWQNFCGKGNKLSLTYEAQYTHAFSYYASRIGANNYAYIVPTQWAHHATLALALRDGRYNLALECRNLTDARLYDNFSLQKPGRAVYAKLRIFLQGKK